ncbi:MAG: DUF3426 domain-containing protein [Polynucleobacter victoriensis]
MSDNNTQKKTLETESAVKPSSKSSKKLKFLAVIASLLLIAFILFQLFYLGRQTIALQVANLPPSAHQSGFKVFRAIDHLVCQYQPCEDIALHDFSAWSIELANLKINPPSKPDADVTGILELQIRNKSDAYVAWPHISLTITDANDAVVTEKLLKPNDWLPKDDSSIDPKGYRGPAEVSSNVLMSLPTTAAGFRASLIYIRDNAPEINNTESKESLPQQTPSSTKE